jgi:FkbM family methyltransferase
VRYLETNPSRLPKERSAVERALTKLKSLRLARMGRLLILGRDLNFADKIKLNYRRKYRPLRITFAGRPMQVADADSFLGAYKEIFFDRVYAFPSATPRPLIIDGGANIGLATLFFKRIYPQSRVIAFEADPSIFELLKQNIGSFHLPNVQLVNAALWNSDTSLSFISERGASGHIATSTDTGDSVPVAAVRLKSSLSLYEKVDFLKLDIEGAEYEVLYDCREELGNVQNLFVEYHSPASSEQRLSRILEILSDAGFRYQIHEAFTLPHPFLDRRLAGQMDLQLNISAFRPESNASYSAS